MSLNSPLNNDIYLDNSAQSKGVETNNTSLQEKDSENEKTAKTSDTKTDENEYQEVCPIETKDEVDNDNELDLKTFKGKFSGELDEVVAVFGHSEIFKALDDDGDGAISANELEKMGLDSDISKLTANDIRMIAKKAGIPANLEYIDEKDYPAPPKEEDEDEASTGSKTKEKNKSDKKDKSEISDSLLQKLKKSFAKNSSKDSAKADKSTKIDNGTTIQSNPPVNYSAASSPSGSGTSYNSGGGGGGGYTQSSNSTGTQNTSSEPDKMSMDKLLSEQTKKQSAVNEASKECSNVQNGTNEKVKAAKEDEETKKEDYEKKLKEDENVSKELKDEQAKIEKNIDAKEKEITNKETAITKAEKEIYNLENTISNLDSQIKALNSSLKALPAKTDENKNKHAEIDAKKAEIEGKIKTAKADKKKADDKKTKTENQKKKDEKELENLKSDLEDLNLERDKNEQEIMDSASDDTKKALEDYQKARENVEKVKEKELQSAQKKLDDAKTELDKVNKSIDELQSMQMQLENRMGSEGEDMVEFAQKLDGLSASEMKEIMRAAGCQFDDGAWCADFVTYVTKQVYGNDNTPGNFAKTCSNTAYCPTIMSWAQQNNVWTSNSSEVQPGDYILYNRNGRAGHIGIVTSVNSDGSVNTIEGNTSDDNGNYTSGVVNQHFNVKSAMGYVLMSKLAA